jgi:flagellar basal body-associated protein FliL
MKNKNFIIGIVFCFLLVLGVCIFLFLPQKTIEEDKNKGKDNNKETPLFQFINQNDFDLSNVDKMVYMKATEGGVSQTDVTDKNEIESYYNLLNKYVIAEETGQACEDNTVVYKFYMKDGTSFSIEIECSWLVYNNKRYLIK